ncbi:hypothetical protein Tco_0204208 [Tanacetum coccineum]
MQYERRVNGKDNSRQQRKRLRYELKRAGYSSRSGNDVHVDDADIRPINNEEPMAENAEQCHDIRSIGLLNKLNTGQLELSINYSSSDNVCLKKTCWPSVKRFAKLEAHKDIRRLAQTKVESEPPNGSNADIPNQCESEQALNVSAGPVPQCVQKTFDRSRSSLGLHGNDVCSHQFRPRSSLQ